MGGFKETSDEGRTAVVEEGGGVRLIAVSRLAWTRHGCEGTSVTESLQHVPFLNEEANRQGSELADLPRETNDKFKLT